MTDNNLGLSPIDLKAYQALSNNQDKIAFLATRKDQRDAMIRGFIAQVMMRNQSCNVMGHVFLKAKRLKIT